jgi:hypothetical protein
LRASILYRPLPPMIPIFTSAMNFYPVKCGGVDTSGERSYRPQNYSGVTR